MSSSQPASEGPEPTVELIRAAQAGDIEGWRKIDERYRRPEIVERFLESFHRGSSLFGPYGALLLSAYQADAEDGRLDEADVESYYRLRERYPEILTLELPPSR